MKQITEKLKRVSKNFRKIYLIKIINYQTTKLKNKKQINYKKNKIQNKIVALKVKTNNLVKII